MSSVESNGSGRSVEDESFKSPLWVRRESFLSRAMLSNDVHQMYEIGRTEDGSMKYNVSVKEGQGFEWNQDLFVSKYYQKTAKLQNDPARRGSAGSPEVQEIIISDSEEDDIFPTDL
ncbi:hypothetical protein TRICI_005844 [Trichomonascus ciferrii]|uniref:Uncharacterized protein n=1 Tax=Trichomonascus ciferrii TaxID=44093 RepID=A0A642UP21_9ASCO|nr:hypothetical protein TRICI_005844 [Trichomonascus ciferrii]